MRPIFHFSSGRFAGNASMVLVAGCAVLAASAGLASADDYESGEIQLELAPGASINAINAVYGTTTLDSLPPLYLLGIPAGDGETEVLDQMEGNPDILQAEYSWKNETPEGERQMVVAAVGGTIDDYLDQHLADRIHLADIQAHLRGDGIRVAVIDTGVLADHPALEGAVTTDGWDFVSNDDDPTDTAGGIDEDGDGVIDEGAGHGTMVAGIVHLVSPGAQILPIRVLNDEGQGRTFAVAKGIRYAVQHGAQVINLSLGLTSRSWVIAHEIEAAASQGIVIVSAVGNDGTESPPVYPASDSRVLSIAALDSSDVKADFSNWRPSVALSAPGVGVMSAYYDGGYAIGAGTSFSTPFVSGQCALILSYSPEIPRDTVEDIVKQGVVDIYGIPGNDPYRGDLGTGRLDGIATWNALTQVSGLPDPRSISAGKLVISPNPALYGTAIALRWDGVPAGRLAASVYDVQGRLVRSLAPSAASSIWDGLGGDGLPVQEGVYFVRMTAESGALRGHGRVTILRR